MVQIALNAMVCCAKLIGFKSQSLAKRSLISVKTKHNALKPVVNKKEPL